MKKATSIALTFLFAGVAVPALAEPDPATVIKMCDQNGDNAVTQKEWETCGAPTAFPAGSDKNQDSKITTEELAAAPSSGSGSATKGN